MPTAEDKARAEPEPVSEPPLADVEHDEEHDEDEHVEQPNGVYTRALIRGEINKQIYLGASEHKKKKKPKKKKKKSKPEPGKQTDPPTIGLSKLFPDGHYPEGEIQEYPNEYVAAPFTYQLYSLFVLHTCLSAP